MSQKSKKLALSPSHLFTSYRCPSRPVGPPLLLPDDPTLKRIFPQNIDSKSRNGHITKSPYSSDLLNTSCACSMSKTGRTSHCDAIPTSELRKVKQMKNRESAARSRARKQAYLHHLELEVAELMEKNAKLQQEIAKLIAATIDADNSNQEKPCLSRTLTAPF